MTAPIEAAYSAFCAAAAAALVSCGFVADAGAVPIDPPEDLEPFGGADALLTCAVIVQGDTKPVRSFLGGPAPRYAVERDVTVELAAAAPDKTARQAAIAAAVTALCRLPAAIEGAAEACEITDLESGDLPPDGLKRNVTFVLRVRAGDPLGLTPA